MTEARTYTAFARHRRLAAGPGPTVAAAAAAARGESHVLVFDDDTGEQVELGSPHLAPEIVPRTAPARGRPRLGVVAREVTLLPRHWDWLAAQPGGASATLRRLVEAASRGGPARIRQAQEAVYRVMSAMAGDLPGFETATRALFAGDAAAFHRAISAWPADVRSYVGRLASPLSDGSPGA